MSAGRPTLVCLTPVKNEAWILERFLAAAGTWADVIIVADQGSTDDSAEIAEAHDKVVLVPNRAATYDEGARQRLLLDAAREHVSGPRVLIALDADEALSSDAQETGEWPRLLGAAPGTVLQFDWANLLPPGDAAWIPPDPIVFGFVDDGAAHDGERIHSTRVPTPEGAPVLTFAEIKVLHLQYLDRERMKAKQRWYQCWERRTNPEKRPIRLYRQYHRMDAFNPAEVVPASSGWLERYRNAGIDLAAVEPQPAFSWDEDVLRWLSEQPDAFRRLDVWDVDWDRRAEALGAGVPVPRDPRSGLDRRVLKWLHATQPMAHTRRTRRTQRALRLLGW